MFLVFSVVVVGSSAMDGRWWCDGRVKGSYIHTSFHYFPTQPASQLPTTHPSRKQKPKTQEQRLAQKSEGKVNRLLREKQW